MHNPDLDFPGQWPWWGYGLLLIVLVPSILLMLLVCVVVAILDLAGRVVRGVFAQGGSMHDSEITQDVVSLHPDHAARLGQPASASCHHWWSGPTGWSVALVLALYVLYMHSTFWYERREMWGGWKQAAGQDVLAESAAQLATVRQDLLGRIAHCERGLATLNTPETVWRAQVADRLEQLEARRP